MPTGTLKLTVLDKKILHSYCQTLDGLSQYLGNGYEIVLHSLENYEHSAIKVINGYHTGRTEGAPITDLALKMLEQIRRNEENDHGVIYFSKNIKGEPLKSTTIPVKGENDRIIGLLCINFYMNTTVADFFQNFAVPLSSASESSSGTTPAFAGQIHETFSQSSSDLLEQTIQTVRQEVLMDSSITSTNKNKEIIFRLYQQGIFHLKDAVITIADALNISKNTVYLHLRNLEKKNGQEPL